MSHDRPIATVILFTVIFGGIALVTMDWASGLFATVLIFFSLVCALNA